MQDRTAKVTQFIQASYPTFEFVPIRLSNAFDKQWWKNIRGRPLAKSDFAVQLDPGALERLTTVSPVLISSQISHSNSWMNPPLPHLNRSKHTSAHCQPRPLFTRVSKRLFGYYSCISPNQQIHLMYCWGHP